MKEGSKILKQTQRKSHDKLPSLASSTLSESKVFQNKSILFQTKRAFLDRFQKQTPRKQENEDDEKKIPFLNRPLIQLSNRSSNFTPFKTINKEQGKQIVSDFKNMRSKSTLLKPLIKAQILSNQKQFKKISAYCEEKAKQERQIINKKIKQMTPSKMKKEPSVKGKYKGKTKVVKWINLYMNYRVYDHNLQGYKPYLDYDSMPFVINRKIYFIGGRKHIPIITYDPTKDKWEQSQTIQALKPFGQCKGSLISPDEILFFGGLQYFQQGFSLICNTVKVVNITKFTVQFRQFSQEKAPPRSFHSQCTYGKFIIISGGIDKNNRLFNNFMNYNYEKQYWCQLTVYSMPQDLKSGFAKHQTLPIFHKRKNYSIYDDQPIIQVNQDIKEQGIYIFGGENSEAELISKMFLMKLGKPSIVISQLKISGKGPLPRKNTEMIHFKSYIIIHGGKNDEMKPFVLNSMHFLNLKTLQWIQVKGQRPPYRYSHTMMVNAGQIVILGGKNTQGLCKQVFSMPFDEKIQYV